MRPDQTQDVLIARAAVVLAVPRQHGVQQLVAIVLQAPSCTHHNDWNATPDLTDQNTGVVQHWSPGSSGPLMPAW